MTAACEAWTESINAVDAFETTIMETGLTKESISFGGVAFLEEDNVDILRSLAVEQEVLDLLDDAGAR